MRSAILLFLLCAAGSAQTPPARQFLFRIEPVRKDFTLQNMTEAERPVVGEHVAYLSGLLAKGTLTFAGQAFDPKGLFGIVVVNAPDSEGAKAILNGDPLIKSKIFTGEVIPFRTVFERGAPQPTGTGSRRAPDGRVNCRLGRGSVTRPPVKAEKLPSPELILQGLGSSQAIP